MATPVVCAYLGLGGIVEGNRDGTESDRCSEDGEYERTSATIKPSKTACVMTHVRYSWQGHKECTATKSPIAEGSSTK